MKFISLICFIIAMVWTWNLIHTAPAVSFETHVGIHDELSSYIEQTLRNKKPGATDFIVQKIWTEETSKANELRAHFTYSFMETNSQNEKTKSTISGWAMLVQEDGPGKPKAAATTSGSAAPTPPETAAVDKPVAPATSDQVQDTSGNLTAQGTMDNPQAGAARLEKTPKAPKRWVISEVQTTNDAILFEEGSTINKSDQQTQ